MAKMRLDEALSALESGKFADILAIAGVPSQGISVLCKQANIKMMMKEGKR